MLNTQLANTELFQQAAFIDGAFVQAASCKNIEVRNPANDELIGFVPNCDAHETRQAIDSAQQAQKHWAKRAAIERANILLNWYDLIMSAQEDLACLLTAEQGKPLPEARGEIAYGASFIRWFAEECRRASGQIIPTFQNDKRLLVMRQPIGVVGAITPWNFPNAMITRKVAPALAAGCAVVLKPAAQTPYSALALAVLAQQAGLPAGLFSVVTGDAAPIGNELTSNPIVRKLTFTGSTAVGAKLYAACAPTIKKVSLELGGNAPFIVFDDADIDAAVEGGLIAKFRNNGQTCVCANRIYVQAGIYDAFLQKLTARLAKEKTGNGFEAGVAFGPLIDQAALEKVEEHIADAVAKGAKVELGGKRHQLGGTFFEPTVLSNSLDTMLIAREETFGPVAPIFRFESEEEVIKRANDSEYGLASYFYSKDLARCFRVSEALDYGMVGVNSGIISTEVAPFGGVKLSGIGREGASTGLEEFEELKYVCMGGI